MLLHSGTTVNYDIEPFLPSYGNKSTDSAYLHTGSPLPVRQALPIAFEATDDK